MNPGNFTNATIYLINDAFYEIEKSVLQFQTISENVSLVGDFNARINISCDYCSVDKRIADELDIGVSDIENDFDSEAVLTSLNLPLQRTSQDSGKINSHGYKFYKCAKA